MKESEQERFWDGGAAPKPPRFFALRQDSWPERRAALALSESRPLSRRSGCVSAEPYPSLSLGPRLWRSPGDAETGCLLITCVTFGSDQAVQAIVEMTLVPLCPPLSMTSVSAI